MSNFTEPRAIGTSLKLYRRLLAAYPREHLAEYGAPMEQLFRDQCRDAWNEARIWGLVKHWLRVIPDLLRTSVLEHITVLKKRKPMLNLFNPRATPLFVFTGVFSIVFMLVLAAAAIVTACLPNSYRSTSRIRVEPEMASYDPYLVQIAFETIRSEPVLSRAVDQINLIERLSTERAGGHKVEKSQAEYFLMHSVDMKPIRNTGIIEINGYSRDPQDAAIIANAVASSYRDFSQKRIQEITAKDVYPITRVSVIESAVSNPVPYAPKKALNIFVGVILGIVLGSITGAASAGFILIRCRRHPNTLTPSGATS